MIEKEQLMLSDYVSWDGEIVQIVELRQDWCIVTKDYEQPQVQYAEVKYEELEPVELTEEILEENEFRLTDEHADFYFEEDGERVSFCLRRMYDRETGKPCGWGRFTYNVLGLIDYVHQLQHAFKLCDINKTIQL